MVPTLLTYWKPTYVSKMYVNSKNLSIYFMYLQTIEFHPFFDGAITQVKGDKVFHRSDAF